MLGRRQQEGLELVVLLYRRGVVLVATDVEPEAIIGIRPHLLAGLEEAPDEVRKVEGLTRRDVFAHAAIQDVDAHAHAVVDRRLLPETGDAAGAAVVTVEIQNAVVTRDGTDVRGHGERVARGDVALVEVDVAESRE